MLKIKKKFIVLLVLSLVFGGLSLFFYKSGKPVHGVLHAKNIPLEIEGWHGVDVPMDERTLQILETKDVLYRVYTKPGLPPVYLCVVFAQNYRKSIHPPEVCFIASGWEVGNKRMISSQQYDYRPEFDATQIMVARNLDEQLVNYWYKAGKRYTSSVYWHQINMALNQILFKSAAGALIRLSTDIQEGSSQEQAQEHLNDFAEKILPHITENLP